MGLSIDSVAQAGVHAGGIPVLTQPIPLCPLSAKPKFAHLSPRNVLTRFFLYPYVGSRPVKEITAQELLSALRRIEARGKHETAHRVRALAGRVLRFAVATGRAERDVAADLKDALAPVKSRNFASVTDPARVGQLLRAIDGYDGQPITALALKLAPLVFVRPGELRGRSGRSLTWRVRSGAFLGLG